MSGLRICLRLLSRRRILARAVPILLIAIAVDLASAEANWTTVGPDGGDARAFAAVPGQPNHLYLGSLDSWVYESVDRGASWHRLLNWTARMTWCWTTSWWTQPIRRRFT